MTVTADWTTDAAARARALQRTIAAINDKGGVGKTSLTSNIAGQVAASVAGDDELPHMPGPEDMLGVVRYERELSRRLRSLPLDGVLTDRAIVTRYLRDALDREELETLRDMSAARMRLVDRAAAFGYESHQAAIRKRRALEKTFAEAARNVGGQILRGARTGTAVADARAKRAKEESWVTANRDRFATAVRGLVAAAPGMGLGRANVDWLEELDEELDEAESVTGDWSRVILQARVAVAEIRRELQARPQVPAPSPEATPLTLLAPLTATLDDLERHLLANREDH